MHRQALDILLVEDDEIDVRVFQEAFKSPIWGYPRLIIAVVHTISSAEEYLRKNTCDVILLDLTLPDAFATEGLKRLTENFPEVAIVIYSGEYSAKLAYECLELGAQEYIIKGVMAHSDLVRTLVHARKRQDILNRSRELSRKLENIVTH